MGVGGIYPKVGAVYAITKEAVTQPDRSVMTRNLPDLGARPFDDKGTAIPAKGVDINDILGKFVPRVATGRCAAHACLQWLKPKPGKDNLHL